VPSAIKRPNTPSTTTLAQHPKPLEGYADVCPKNTDGQHRLVSIHIKQFLHAADWDTEHNHIMKLLKV
jgi:hypothetical protein